MDEVKKPAVNERNVALTAHVLGVSLQRARFIRAIEAGLIDGDVIAVGDGGGPDLTKSHDVSREPRNERGEWTRERYTAALRDWAYDTKVVNPDGTPKMVYHGTSVGQDFDAFKPGKRGQWGRGIYFTDSPDYADFFANEQHGPSPRIIPVYLRLRNPYIWQRDSRDFDALQAMMQDKGGEAKHIPARVKAMGHDGILIPGENGLPSQYVAFWASQIKSAYGNSGMFDGFDERMNKSRHDAFARATKSYDPDEPRDQRGRWVKVPVSDEVMSVLRTLKRHGGTPLIVGGSVRDAIAGKPVKDVDIENYGLDSDKLIAALSEHGKVDAVGQSFGVYKLRLRNGEDLDVSVPRRENKTGAGYRGFDVAPDPHMTPEEASHRRDFTMNAMAYDPFTGEVLDFHGGAAHLEQGTLRHVGPAFAEDPLRVLRAMQFAGRFGMQLDAETAELARSLKDEYPHIAKERIWVEWEKLLTKASRPALGLEVLRQSGWDEFYPELQALQGVPQEPDWHPEGDAWVHTLHVADEAARIAERDGLKGDQRAILVLAAICHDFGKAVPGITKVEVKNGTDRITSHGHDDAGVAPAESFLKRIGCPLSLRQPILTLVKEHMAHTGVEATPRNVRRLASRLDPLTVQEWERIVEADHSGRPPLPRHRPAEHWVGIADSLGAAKGKEKPLVGGAMLINRGHKPGPEFKGILNAAYEAQLEGDLTEANKDQWLDDHLAAMAKSDDHWRTEARDDHGRWTDQGGDTQAPASVEDSERATDESWYADSADAVEYVRQSLDRRRELLAATVPFNKKTARKVGGPGKTKPYKVVYFNGNQLGGELLVKLLSGQRKSALYKTIPAGTEFEREESACYINRVMGGLVDMPEAVKREVNGETALVQNYVNSYGPVVDDFNLVWKKQLPIEDVLSMATFDAVIGNMDRHWGNALLQKNAEGDYHLVAIDHGLSFPAPFTLKNPPVRYGNHEAIRYAHEQGFDYFDWKEDQALRSLWANRTTVTSHLRKLGLPEDAVDEMWRRVVWMRESARIPTATDMRDRPWRNYSPTGEEDDDHEA